MSEALESIWEEEQKLLDRLMAGEYYLGEGDGTTILARLGQIAMESAKEES